MIQRVQTLFLLGVAILMILVLVFPIWSNQGINMQAVLDAYSIKILQEDQILKTESVWYIAALAVLSAITAFFSIFQFKKRKMQLQLNMLNNLIIAVTVAMYFVAINTANEMVQAADSPKFKIGFFLPLVALVFNILASRYIGKDEKLVRSMDRLR